MFTIEKIQEGTEKFQSACEVVLKELSKQLECETLDLKFDLNNDSKNKNQVNRFKLVSEPLPEKSLGLWKHSVKEMNIVLSASVMEDGKIIFSSRFFYEHRDGGMNGCSISESNGKNLVFRFDENVLTVG